MINKRDGSRISKKATYARVITKDDIQNFKDQLISEEKATFDSKTIKITFPSDTLIHHYAFFEKDSIKEMISEGYEKTTAILSSYFQKGYDNLDYIYKKIEADNRTSNGKLRITGDILATNMNKVTQMLTKRNIY